MFKHLITIFLFTLNMLLFVAVQQVRAENRISLGQAIQKIKRQQNVKIISATTIQNKYQQNIHNIRVLTPHGKVKRLQINEKNGQFIRTRKR